MATQSKINKKATETLLYQLLETELGGVKIYEKALECAVTKELQKEFSKYLDETREHVKIAREVLQAAGLDPEAEVPARTIVRLKGEAFLEVMDAALEEGDPEAAEVAACECVVDAETKDHLNWHLLGEVAKSLSGDLSKVFKEAYEKVEKEEDHHIYHTKGWTRELWLKSLGLKAVIPPPEERKEVETAIGAARAEKARTEFTKQ